MPVLRAVVLACQILTAGQLIAAPPAINGLPTEVRFVEGHRLELRATVTSDPPAQFRWLRQGQVINGAVTAELVRRNLQLGDAGIYTLEATNADGTTSAEIRVEVKPGPSHPGSVDIRFDAGDGIESLGAKTPISLPGMLIARDDSARILLAGEFNGFSGENRSHAVALKSDGAVDSDFTLQMTVAGTSIRRVTAIQPLSGGRLLLGVQTGRTPVGPADASRVVRVDRNGRMDASFTPEGSATVGSRITTLAVDDSDRVLVGRFTASPLLSRLTPNGATDPGFHTPAFTGPALSAVAVRVVLPQAGGANLVGGQFSAVDGMPAPGLVRLASDGTVDASFKPELPDGAGVSAIAAGPGDTLVVGLLDAPGVVRLLGTGKLDPSFQAPPEIAQSGATGLALDSAGCVVVITRRIPPAPALLVRLLHDGSMDPEFTLLPDLRSSGLSLSVDADDQILAAGDFFEISGTSRASVVRLNGSDERRIVPFRKSPTEGGLRIQTRSARRYTIEHSDSLTVPGWKAVHEVNGTGAVAEWTPSEALRSGYFRLVID